MFRHVCRHDFTGGVVDESVDACFMSAPEPVVIGTVNLYKLSFSLPAMACKMDGRLVPFSVPRGLIPDGSEGFLYERFRRFKPEVFIQ